MEHKQPVYPSEQTMLTTITRQFNTFLHVLLGVYLHVINNKYLLSCAIPE